MVNASVELNQERFSVEINEQADERHGRRMERDDQDHKELKKFSLLNKTFKDSAGKKSKRFMKGNEYH